LFLVLVLLLFFARYFFSLLLQDFMLSLSERLHVVSNVLPPQSFTSQIPNIPHSHETQVHIKILKTSALL